MSLVGPLGLSYHRTFLGLKFIFVGISLVQNVFSWVFPGSKTFSWGPRFFLLVFVSQKFFSRGNFYWSEFFFMCSIVGPKFFLMYILWVHKLLSWVFHGCIVPSCLLGSEISFRGYFVGPKRFLEVQDFSYCYLLVKSFFTWVFLLVRIFFSCAVLWVQNFFSCVFYRFKNFPRGYFVGQNFSHVGVLWVRNFMVLVEGKMGAEGNRTEALVRK